MRAQEVDTLSGAAAPSFRRPEAVLDRKGRGSCAELARGGAGPVGAEDMFLRGKCRTLLCSEIMC